MSETKRHWWEKGVVYQVYPWSFRDTNGDGIGDLRGIAEELEYLVSLGVDALWISPIYPSPMLDFGYDITDHCAIDARFGTLADFDALLERAHGLGLKVILDYVPNHTSDQHPWFRAAQSSLGNPYRDHYIWHDPAADGGPPTNWLSEFGGSAWQYEPATRQYYYHAYLKQQPDLNFRNPEVVRALLAVLEFWLARGVDGFRIDTIHHLIKDDQFRNNPENPDFRPGMPPHRSLLRRYTTDRPEVHEAIAKMRRVVDAHADRVLIGEAYLPTERLMRYYGSELSGLHLPFNFQLIYARWEAKAIAELAQSYDAALPQGAWPNWVLGNHDRSRIKSRVGAAQARVAAMLLLTLRGTPTIYYGDELGMQDVPIPAELVRDPWERNVPGLGLGRDPERTPMQWSAAAHAGFTTGTPWLPVAADANECNVERELADPGSMLSLYRGLLALRREHAALSVGTFRVLDVGPDVLAFERTLADATFTVLLNFSDHEPPPRALDSGAQRLIASTLPARVVGSTETRILLGPNEAVILGK